MVSQMQDDGEYTNLSLVISKGDLGCIDEAINTIKVQLPHIEINNDIPVNEMIDTIFHELKHVQQIERKPLYFRISNKFKYSYLIFTRFIR